MSWRPGRDPARCRMRSEHGVDGESGSRRGGAVMGTICIAIPDSVWSAHSEQFYTQVLHGLEDIAVPRGHGVLSRVARDVDEELDALRRWAEQLPEAVAVLKDLREDDARPLLADRLGLPYVVICDERDRRRSSRVTVDNVGTMRRQIGRASCRERGEVQENAVEVKEEILVGSQGENNTENREH